MCRLPLGHVARAWIGHSLGFNGGLCAKDTTAKKRALTDGGRSGMDPISLLGCVVDQ